MKKGFQNVESKLGNNTERKTHNAEDPVDCKLHPRSPRIPMPPFIGNPVIFSFGGALAGIIFGFLLKFVLKMH